MNKTWKESTPVERIEYKIKNITRAISDMEKRLEKIKHGLIDGLGNKAAESHESYIKTLYRELDTEQSKLASLA